VSALRNNVVFVTLLSLVSLVSAYALRLDSFSNVDPPHERLHLKRVSWFSGLV
jgi:hypothetical protein